jgi:hypothetical protein
VGCADTRPGGIRYEDNGAVGCHHAEQEPATARDEAIRFADKPCGFRDFDMIAVNLTCDGQAARGKIEGGEEACAILKDILAPVASAYREVE